MKKAAGKAVLLPECKRQYHIEGTKTMGGNVYTRRSLKLRKLSFHEDGRWKIYEYFP